MYAGGTPRYAGRPTMYPYAAWLGVCWEQRLKIDKFSPTWVEIYHILPKSP
jgi:hypothetical protein